jgi:hypothetical protein
MTVRPRPKTFSLRVFPVPSERPRGSLCLQSTFVCRPDQEGRSIRQKTGSAAAATRQACRIAQLTVCVGPVQCVWRMLGAHLSRSRPSQATKVARYAKAADQERNAKQALANLLRSESEQTFPTFGSGWTKIANNAAKTDQFLEDGAPERMRRSQIDQILELSNPGKPAQ